jgi:uncharacterized protein YbjT (DUF2867 family)
MKYVLTGSNGHISGPLAQKLVAAGHTVRVITSNAGKTEAIEKLGATALVGSMEDGDFLKSAFAEADAVYLMIPPKLDVTDWLAYQTGIVVNLVDAVKANSIKHVLALSSVGAHMKNGAGPVDGLAVLEDHLAAVEGLHVKSLRPSYFFNNLYSLAGMAKHMGIIGSTQPANHSLVLTDPNDIADAAFEELNSLNFTGFSVRYIASDERTWSEIASVLGEAIGKPDLPYVEFTDEQSEAGMNQMGLAPTIVAGYIAMGQALRSGEMERDFKANRPTQFGKVKLEDFAKAFAGAYHSA